MHTQRHQRLRASIVATISLLALAILSTGCRTSRPPALNLAFEDLEPELKGKRITITGRVDGLQHAIGSTQGSFTFELVGSRLDDRLLCSESGYNTLILSEVVNLLARAEQRGIPVTVTGTLRVGPFGEILEGSRLEVDTVSILGNVIDTDYKDYVRYPHWAWYYYDDC